MMRQTATASVIRRINHTAILDLIRQNSPIARSQIAKRLGVSLPTVMRVVDDLIEEDLVRPLGSSEASGGRPRSLLEFNSQAYSVLGVDLGGTRLYGAITDLGGNIQQELELPLDSCSPDQNVGNLCHLIQVLLNAPRPANQQMRGIGLGVPSVISSNSGMVTWAPSLGWRHLNLKEILAERFHIPVFIENDVNLAALGELGYGIGQGFQNLVCIAIGSGIGAGIILDGALYRGNLEASGEIGYMLPGVEYLGQRYEGFGALENLASYHGIVRRTRHLLEELDCPDVMPEIDAEGIFLAARVVTPWARQVIDETIDYLSLAIANISALLNPELVILSGSISRYADLFVSPIRKRLEGVVPYLPRIEASPYGRQATVLGAIMLVLNATTDSTVVKKLR